MLPLPTVWHPPRPPPSRCDRRTRPGGHLPAAPSLALKPHQDYLLRLLAATRRRRAQADELVERAGADMRRAMDHPGDIRANASLATAFGVPLPAHLATTRSTRAQHSARHVAALSIGAHARGMLARRYLGSAALFRDLHHRRHVAACLLQASCRMRRDRFRFRQVQAARAALSIAWDTLLPHNHPFTTHHPTPPPPLVPRPATSAPMHQLDPLGRQRRPLPPNIIVGTGHVHYTHEFPYLGNRLCSSLSDRGELTHRIGLASYAFARLATPIFAARDVPLRVKALIYEAIILAILLYGCESLAFDAFMRGRLRRFHGDCVRRMCGVNRWQQHRHHLSQGILLLRVGLHPIDEYVRRRKLQWWGHVARMEPSRLPKQLMLSWIAHRPTGGGRTSLATDMEWWLRREGLSCRDGSWYTEAHRCVGLRGIHE